MTDISFQQLVDRTIGIAARGFTATGGHSARERKEDILAEIRLHLYKKRAKIEAADNPPRYAVYTARAVAIDWGVGRDRKKAGLMRGHEYKTVSEEFCVNAQAPPTMEREVEARMLVRDCQIRLKEKPKSWQAMFEHMLNGLSDRDAAQEMGVTHKAAQALRKRIRVYLQSRVAV